MSQTRLVPKPGPLARLRYQLARWLFPLPAPTAKFYSSYGLGLSDDTDQTQIARSYGSYVEEGFRRNAIIYSAIMYKAKASTAAPLRAYTNTPRPEELEYTDPLVQLINRPNPHQSGIEFQALNTVYLNLAGECYILLDRGVRFGKQQSSDTPNLPDAMYTLRPDRVRVVVNTKLQGQHPGGRDAILGYAYFPEGVSTVQDPRAMPMLPEDIIHIVLPNPGDRWEGAGSGLSPVEPMAQSGDVDNMVTDFLKRFFERGAMFSGLLRFDAPMLDADMARVRQFFMEVYGGYKNWSEVGVLDNGGHYERIGLTFDEMGFETIDKRNGARIVMPFGVPAALIGDPAAMERATYNNLIELRRIFWEDTFLPEMRLFQEAYQQALLGINSDKILRFDTSAVPALSRDLPALIDAAYKAWTMGVPADAAFGFLNLNIPEYVGSDVSYIPINMVQVGKGWVGNDGGDPEWFGQGEDRQPSDAGVSNDMTDEEDQDGDDATNESDNAQSKALSATSEAPVPSATAITKSLTERQQLKLRHKKLLGKALDTLATNFENSFRNATDEALANDQRNILSALSKAAAVFLERKQTIDYDAIFHAWEGYLDEDSKDNWSILLTPLILAAFQSAAEYWMQVYDIELNVSGIQTTEWFVAYVDQITTSISTTTKDFLSAFLIQAKSEGWSYEQMRNHLLDVFAQWQDGTLNPDDFDWLDVAAPVWRLETIVRTETMRAMNASTYHLFSDWGAELKEWIAVNDHRTRDTHVKATSDYTEGGSLGPIPYDQPFVVGGYELMYPLDPFGPPQEVCNCRCVSVPFLS